MIRLILKKYMNKNMKDGWEDKRKTEMRRPVMILSQ